MQLSICTESDTVFVLIVFFAVMKQVSPLCTPPDARWQQYTPTLSPMVFEGTSTSGGCSGTMCIGPAFGTPAASRLGDGDHGTAVFDLNAVHAWNMNVNIEFHFPSMVTVGGINLYFYNIPSRNIGLPYDTDVISNPGIPSFIEGNQDISQNDNQLRNVKLIPRATAESKRFTIQFNFSNIDKIDWLLLTEVELCTSAVTILNPIPITFTGDTANNIFPTSINSTISLSCSVVNEGRFTWSWTLPSGVTQPPTFILDAGRTSVLEVTSNETGDYQCRVGYSGLAGVQTEPSAVFNITLTSEDNTAGIEVVVGTTCAVLLVLIFVAVALTITAVFVIKHKRHTQSGTDNIYEDTHSPQAIKTQDRNPQDCSTIKTNENKAYETTNPESISAETGQSLSPLYACVKKKKKATKEDNQEDESDVSYPPSCNALYAVVQKKPNQGGNDVNQDDFESLQIGYEDMYTAVQKKKKQAPVSDDQQDDEIECYPEHVYSAVQKKKLKNDPNKETISLSETYPTVSESLDSPSHDLKDMYAVVQKKPKN